ncbi:glycosyltransferase [Blastopirellula retiformator]|uniref:GDP-mannose:cellobiosyl-diphosphopolyprenol alpha-mannosyltransferase n=1 Tax=Blastopirellula retiformator TaxID=2527970 RepID=A0A5C5V7W1_9BACT|nr:glycosyltransferase [Blastopirellula retiformator]TWT34638.1 GDP-mannose:cellobiosyl-diphosphopolyprenol alpha-mannosyltransferase [Blastopirellula retiformator]
MTALSFQSNSALPTVGSPAPTQEIAEEGTVHSARRPTVVHLGKYYHPSRGGIETHVRDLARGLVRNGYATKVVCINDQSADPRRRFGVITRTPDARTEDEGVSIFRAGRIANVMRLDVCPRLTWALRQEIEGCDLIHLHLPNPTMMIALARLRPQVPVVVTWHSDIVRQRIAAKILYPLESWTLRNCRQILVSNPRYAEGSESLRPYADKLKVVPFGMPLERYLSPSPEVLSRADQLRAQWPGPIWLSVGRLVYYKGMHVAIEALRDVPGTLVIVGSGSKEAELRALAEKQGVQDRIVWMGNADDQTLQALYQIATALWFPSIARSEAFGLAQVEAMASGCPVINCEIQHSGVPWVSAHGESGLTVPVESAEQFAAAANQIHSSETLRAELSSGARRRAEELFNLQAMVDRTGREYETLLRKRS